MTLILRKYFHPLSGRLIFWNAIILVFVKLILPYSAFQLASIIGSLPVFDSRDIIALTNQVRSANQLTSLKANTQLDLAAEEKLNDMALEEYFAHISPNGVSPWFWIKKAEYQYSVAGENLAIGFTTPKETVQAWIDSPSHKANILNSQYRDIGVAVKGVKIGEDQGILVVQMFGSPRLSYGKTNRPVIQTALTASVPLPSPIPARTPIVTPSASPTLTPTVTNIQTRGATEASIQQYVSTDIEIPPVKTPIIIPLQDNEKVKKWTEVLSNTFTIYSFAIAVLSIIALFFIERNRGMAIKLSLHTAILILAVSLPAVKLTFEALIF